MSRFYDVLKEASRLQPPNGNGENPRQEIIPAEVIVGTDFVENTAPTPELHTESAPIPIRTAGEGLWPEAPRKSTGVAVHASLDRRARLIPHSADSVVVEHYRRLRTKLLQEHEGRPFRSLMIGSPNPQEGKTVTALNLALSYAMLPSCRVLIVDGDLRKGSLGKWLAVDGPPGLSDLIEGTATMKEVILKAEELPIHFVLRGNSKILAGELLNSSHLKDYFRQMAEQFDIVIVDSPPVNLITDAQLLAGCCDAVLLVARAFSTTRKAFEKTVQDLQSFRIVGTILNGGTRMQNYRRYNHYY
jgi:capsular exopolysaccharide synthesis family protein